MSRQAQWLDMDLVDLYYNQGLTDRSHCNPKNKAKIILEIKYIFKIILK